jgi:hypothetical protein
MCKLYFLETQTQINGSQKSHLNPLDWKRSTGVLFAWDVLIDRYGQFNKFPKHKFTSRVL